MAKSSQCSDDACFIPDDKSCCNIFRSNTGEAYGNKLDYISGLLVKNGTNLHDFIHDVFSDDVFVGTNISKSNFVLQVLHDNLSIENWRFLRMKLRQLAYLTDRRHPEEYVFDVILGWLTEILVCNEILKASNNNFYVRRVGVDQDMELLSMNIRAVADIQTKCKTCKATKLIDIFADQRGTWKKNGKMDLKKGKINHFNSNKLDFVLGLDLSSASWHLVTRKMTTGLTFSSNAAMGGTQTMGVPLPKPMVIQDILDQLCDCA